MTHIEVWADRTSEPGRMSWIVSHEDEIGSDTIAVFPGTDAGHRRAIVRARAEARRYELDVRET